MKTSNSGKNMKQVSKAMDIWMPYVHHPMKSWPSCEMRADSAQYVFAFDVPGFANDEVTVEFENNNICLSGDKKDFVTGSDTKLTKASHIKFIKQFPLPWDAVSRFARVKYDDGIVRVEIPRKQATANGALATKYF